MQSIKTYQNIPLQKIKIEDVSIGFRQVGTGEDLVFIHGFPTHGYTWRKLIPRLSAKYSCSILDLPGLGDSDWSANTDFKSSAQARYVLQLLAKKGINKCTLIAHNSGATVARVMAIEAPEKIDNLVLFNTEIPNHRPPWIPFYQQVGLLPLVPFFIQIALRQKWFVKSPMGFKEAYTDKTMFENKNNLGPYLDPVTNSKRKIIGAFKYLKGIDWKVIDEFETNHQKIKANVLFIWGEKDRTFPLAIAKNMLGQFNTKCEFKIIKNAALLPHEEQAEAVNNAILEFI